MRKVASSIRQKKSQLAASLGILALIVLAGCLTAPTRHGYPTSTTDYSSIDCLDNCPAIKVSESPKNETTGIYHSMPTCASSAYFTSTVVITDKKRINAQWGGALARYDQQLGWLSISLEPIVGEIPYAEPVPLRLIYTNTRNVPVVFSRPQYISFVGDITLEPNQPSRLLISLVSFSGERVMPTPFMATQLRYTPPPMKEFSLLLPGQSCSIELPLLWDKTHLPLDEPIPPGKYKLRAISQHFDLGPSTGDNTTDLWDVGAWVGETEASSTMTFTVSPAK